MSEIQVFSEGHSTASLRAEDRTLVIDPGTWADPSVFTGVDAFLVTHEHFDHCDPKRIAEALAQNDATQVWASAPAVRVLADAGAPSKQVHTVTPGDSFTAAGFHVSVHGGEHATIHPVIPGTKNNTYLIDDRVYHPGDSFDAPTTGSAEFLFLPVAAPWLDLHGAADFAEEVRPLVTSPIHDFVLSEKGRDVTDTIMTQIFDTVLPGTQYRRGGPEAPVFTYSVEA